MKKLIILLLALTATFGTFAQKGKDKITNSKTNSKIQTEYYCPMHPDVVSDTMGKCPKCGMYRQTIRTTEIKNQKNLYMPHACRCYK